MQLLADDAQVEEATSWSKKLEITADILAKRIRSNIARGCSVVTDSGIQVLYKTLIEQHAELLRKMHQLDEERDYHVSLQERLNHISDIRSSIKKRQHEFAIQKLQKEEAEIQARRQSVYGPRYIKSLNNFPEQVPNYNFPIFRDDGRVGLSYGSAPAPFVQQMQYAPAAFQNPLEQSGYTSIQTHNQQPKTSMTSIPQPVAIIGYQDNSEQNPTSTPNHETVNETPLISFD